MEVIHPPRRFTSATYQSKTSGAAEKAGAGRAPVPPRKMAMKLAITLRLGLAGLLIAILCLGTFVFSDIASESPLVAFSAIAGASTAILMVLYFDARKD